MGYHIQKIIEGEYDIGYNQSGPIILDIGANIGAFSLWANYRWPASKIFSYEPHPETFKLLTENLQRFENISLHNFAIGFPTWNKLYEGKNNIGEASFFRLGEQSEDFTTVKTESVDILPKANILKLDVEGAEVDILSSMSEIDYDVVLLEYHSDRNRRFVDRILNNYLLIGNNVTNFNRGILKYIHKKLIQEPSYGY